MKVLYSKDWKRISKETIEKRGNRCERCGKSPPAVPWLTSHHIDGNPSNNDDDNLFVCCPRCHFFIDRYIYPRKPTPLSNGQLLLKEVK